MFLSVSVENEQTQMQTIVMLEKQQPNFKEAQEQREIWGAMSQTQRTEINSMFAFI